MIVKYWKAPRVWPGETAYIVAGGTSARTQNLEPLRSKKVLVLNSSYERVPWAQYLIFGDVRWWNEHKSKPELLSFPGQICGATRVAKQDSKRTFNRLKKIGPPPGLYEYSDGVIMARTVLHAGINLLAHFGVARIVLIAADMGRAPDGTTHHHTPHRWKNKPGNASWDRQMKQLKMAVDPLKARGIEVLNASPVSRIPWWPKIDLEEAYAKF